MKAEYDFSRGERGKFYNPDAVLSFPIYLELDVDEFIRQIARQGRTLHPFTSHDQRPTARSGCSR
jgi:hypothetical protein